VSVGLEPPLHFHGNCQPLLPSGWHPIAVRETFQQRWVIFLVNPIGSDRWWWPAL
jgi:hypothetical protein